MLSQTQTHTVLRSPGPAVDPAFSPSTPEEDDFRGKSDGSKEIRQDSICLYCTLRFSFEKLKTRKRANTKR